MPEFTGGAAMKAKLDELARKVGRGGAVRVGFLSGATYPDGMSVPLVASLNEFGAPSRGQPPRPFFRRMINEKQGEWPAAIEQTLVANDYDVDRTLGQVGEGIAGQLRQSIIDLVEPPLKPSTIRAKGGVTKPLIDTGVMLNSVSYEVETDK